MRIHSPFWLIISLSLICIQAKEFNYEVEKRVVDRLRYYMDQAVDTNRLLANFRFSGGNDYAPSDRDAYLRLNHALPLPLIYYGMEDGSITGFFKGGSTTMGYYREPGDGGYPVQVNNEGVYSAVDPSMQKHLKSCIDKNSGTPQDCLMKAGDQFIQCATEDCQTVEPCLDETSQRDCEQMDDEAERQKCRAQIKYCIQYTIETITEDDHTQQPRGFIPLTNYCHDIHGIFTQESGKVVQGYTPSTYDLAANVNLDGTSSLVHSFGDCMYGDGTIVQRGGESEQFDYAYCGGNGQACDNTFVGGFESNEYDPRYRPWYILTKQEQKPQWLDPFAFFDLALGITATHPIYNDIQVPDDNESGGTKLQRVFAGVLAVDYRLEDIGSFLEEYGNSTSGELQTLVAVYEDKEPYYIIGLSTGTAATELVLTEDSTQPCPVDSGTNVPCTPTRISMYDLETKSPSKDDTILARSFQEHTDRQYPQELVAVNLGRNGDSNVYLSQSTVYEQPETNLKWRVIVASPGDKSDSDSIEASNNTGLFAMILTIGFLGFLLCTILLVVFYSKRQEKAAAYADWRFTCAFIGGCALWCGASIMTLVGPNTDAMCMTRMWTFHLLFVAALAPLFVKIWRVWKLSKNLRRRTITHLTAAMYMLPPILMQFSILFVLSFLDPPRSTTKIDAEGGIITQRIVCDAETPAVFIATLVFECFLVIMGCVLAWQTRNLDEKFGEAKRLAFAMYNVALIGGLFWLVISIVDVTPNAESILRAIGIFWISVTSSSIFVIPRLLQIKKSSENRKAGMSENVRISITPSSLPFQPRSTVSSEEAGDPTEKSTPLEPVQEC